MFGAHNFQQKEHRSCRTSLRRASVPYARYTPSSLLRHARRSRRSFDSERWTQGVRAISSESVERRVSVAYETGDRTEVLRRVALGLMLAVLGCTNNDSPSKKAVVPAAPPIAISGCESTRAQPPSCAMGSVRTLSLWVESSAPLEIWIDGEHVAATTRTIEADPGTAVSVEVPVGASALEVRTQGRSPWTIALTEEPSMPQLNALFDARDLEGLLTHAQGLEGRARAIAQHRISLVHYGRGERSQAAQAAHRGLDVALDEGAVTVAVRLAMLLQHFQEGLGAPAEQRYVAGLVDLYLPAVLDARQRTLAHFHRGKLARTQHDLRRAHDEFESAARWARRLGLAEEELSTLALSMPMLALLGRTQDADAAVTRMLALIAKRPAAEACNDAAYLSAAGWALSVSAFTAGASNDAAPLLEQALQLLTPQGGCDPGQNPNLRYALEETRFNYAFDALVRGQHADAQARIDAMDSASLSDEHRRYVAFVRARVALASGDGEAAQAALSSVDVGPSDPLLSWMWSIARGEAFDALEDHKGALAAYEEAERKLDQAIAAVGVDHGRESMAMGFRTGTTRLIERHLTQGDMEAVVAAARRARGRTWTPLHSAARLAQAPAATRAQYEQHLSRYRTVSRSVQQRLQDLWTLNAAARVEAQVELKQAREQMRAHLDRAYAVLDAAPHVQPVWRRPAPGELWLLYVPLEETWLGLAIHAETIEHARIRVPTGALDDLDGAALLRPFAEAIDAAQQVRLLPSGDVWQVPLHAATWKEAPLIEHKPVAYTLDLGAPPSSNDGQKGHALIVVDPASKGQGLGRLANAPAEAAIVQQALEGAGWGTQRIEGHEATYEAFVDGLQGARWLHYAGHGQAGKRSGWDAALPLAGEARLDVRSILALPGTPHTVVLSGCETGRTRSQRVGGGVHLAAAFLLAGSHAVVAASDTLVDTDALALSKALYEATSLDADAAERFRAGVQTFRQQHPESDAWRDLRLWMR